MRRYLCISEDGQHFWDVTYETNTKPFISHINCPDHDGRPINEAPDQDSNAGEIFDYITE